MSQYYIIVLHFLVVWSFFRQKNGTRSGLIHIVMLVFDYDKPWNKLFKWGKTDLEVIYPAQDVNHDVVPVDSPALPAAAAYKTFIIKKLP